MTHPRRPFSRRILTSCAWLTGMAGTFAALSLSWWWKIDEKRSPQQIPQAAFQQSLDLGQIWLTPLAVRVDQGGQDLRITLEAVLENRTSHTQTAPFGVPARLPRLLVSGAALPEPQVILLRDQEPLIALQPRMPERVQITWAADAIAPEDLLQVEFSKQSFKLQDNFYGKSGWLGSQVAAVLPLAQAGG